MKAVITVLGRDAVGILAKVATVCADCNVNIEEVTQSILGGVFAMIMVVDVSACPMVFADLVTELEAEGKRMGLTIHAQREDIFNAMHRI